MYGPGVPFFDVFSVLVPAALFLGALYVALAIFQGRSSQAAEAPPDVTSSVLKIGSKPFTRLRSIRMTSSFMEGLMEATLLWKVARPSAHPTRRWRRKFHPESLWNRE